MKRARQDLLRVDARRSRYVRSGGLRSLLLCVLCYKPFLVISIFISISIFIFISISIFTSPSTSIINLLCYAMLCYLILSKVKPFRLPCAHVTGRRNWVTNAYALLQSRVVQIKIRWAFRSGRKSRLYFHVASPQSHLM